MAITDFTLNEVRIRAGSKFTQIPNFTTAGELLLDGQFIAQSTPDGLYVKADQDVRATHFVRKAGVARVTAEEITNKTGTVQVGEPVMAVTGLGTVTIPFGSDVTEGQALTTKNGYAVAWSDDTGAAGAFIIGVATQDVIIPSGETIEWGEAMIDLPAKFSPATTSEVS